MTETTSEYSFFMLQGLRTVIVSNNSIEAQAAQEAARHHELWTAFPDDQPLRTLALYEARCLCCGCLVLHLLLDSTRPPNAACKPHCPNGRDGIVHMTSQVHMA